MDSIKIIDGTYEVLAELGRGAQGTIYKVRDLHSSTVLSLKMINLPKIRQLDDNALKESIKAEFKIIKNLEHPNIIKVFDFGFDQEQQRYYFTMEFLDGKNIAHHLTNDCQSDRFTDLVYQCLLGLNYLHANNIIHFDIKPDNIFIVDKHDGTFQVKILDFGLSELKSENLNLKAKGTLIYMAPEIFIDHTRVSHQIDLYSLGISLLHSLFEKKELYSLSSIISSQEVVKGLNNAHQENEELLSRLENRKTARFISQLIEPSPEIRLSSATEAVSALNRVFNKNYALPQISKTTTLINNTKFLIREEIIAQLLSANERCHEGRGTTIFIESESGAGKTRIIKRLNYILSLQLQRVIRIESANANPRFKDLALSLCDKIYSIYHNIIEIRKEYEYLKGLLENDTKDQKPFTDSILKMLNTTPTKSHPVIIIEDFDKYQADARNFIQKLIAVAPAYNLFVICTISTDSPNSDALDFFHILASEPNTAVIKIEPLIHKELEIIEEELLGIISNKPKDLINNILAISQGNFRKTLQIYDYMIDNNIIQKISSSYYFNTQSKYHELISSGFNHYLADTFNKLSSEEIRALALLTASYFKLKIADLARILDTNVYELRKRMQNLAAHRIVRKHISHEEEYYLLESEEVKEFVINKVSTKEIWHFYKELFETKLSSSTIATHLNTLCTTLFEDNYSEDTDLTKPFIDLMAQDSNNSYYYIITNFIRMTKNKEFRFRLNIELFHYYHYKNKELCKKQIRKLNASFPYIKLKNNITAFIILKMQYAFSRDIIKVDVTKLLDKNIKLLTENVQTNILCDAFTNLIAAKAAEHGKKDEAIKAYNYFNTYLETNKNISPAYQIYLTEYAIQINLIDFDIKKIDDIVVAINTLTKEQRTEEIYFDAIYHFTETLKQTLNYGESKWKNYEGVIKTAIADAVVLKKRDFVLSAMTAATKFYYSAAQYEKCFSYYEKIFEYDKKHSSSLAYTIYADFASLKYYLYYPVNEIISIYEFMKTQDKENDNLQNFMILTFNQLFLEYKAGNLNQARNLFITGINYFKFLSEDFCEYQYKRVSQFLPDIFYRDEVLLIAEKLLKDNSIHKRTFDYIISSTDNAYKENCWSKYHTEDYKNKLTGDLSIFTPVFLMEYIRKEKRLPPANIVIQNVSSEYTNPKIYGSYLAYLICQVMMTKNEKKITEISDTAKKLYIHGYVITVIYALIPLLEFCVYLKFQPAGFKQILKIYMDAEEQLFSNIDEKQTAIFKNNKIYRYGLKALERLKKKED